MPKALLLLAVVLLAARLGRTQQPNDSLTAGQALLDGQTLVSAQGIFTLGFFPNGDNTYLGIWYNNMKPRTVVWVANRDAPIKGGNGSLTLSTNSLDLLDRRGNIVWSRSRFSTNSPQAFLLDSGNLVINDSVSSGPPNPLWQSFAEPCDTLLSGMTIGYDTSPTIQYTQLVSWKSVSDPSTGSYSIRLDPRRRPPELLLYNALPEPDVCRVPKALPSAQYRALGKITIRRVPTKKHSANRQHSAEENFAECLNQDTRRTHLCRVPRGQHSATSVTCATQARTRPLQRGRR